MKVASLADTLNLFKEIDQARSVEAIASHLLFNLADFGVESVMASLLPGLGNLRRYNQRFLVMAEVPKQWQDYYLRRKYVLIDPVVRESLLRTSGFGWDDDDFTIKRDDRAALIMHEAAENGLRRGYTVPMSTIEGAQGGVTFAGRHMDLAPQERGTLTLVAAYAFGHALLIHDQEGAPRTALSPRERETLYWLAEGKTDAEIGEFMKISEHGVDRHLRGIRAKLGTKNRAQAVAEGFRHKLIA